MRSGEKLSMRKNRPVRQGAERSGSGEQSGQLCVFGGAAPGLFHRVLGGVLIHLGVQDLIQIQACFSRTVKTPLSISVSPSVCLLPDTAASSA